MLKFLTLELALVFALLAAGCKQKQGGGGQPGAFVIQVVAVEAKRQPVIESLSLVGSIAANMMIEVKTEVDGTVQEILSNEGQRVEKGQELLRLDETKLAAALAEAESNFKLSRANLERARQLFKDKLISQQEYEQLAATFESNQATLDRRKRELKDARVYAPFAGIVGAHNVSPGQVIGKNTTLTWLTDLDPVKVEINVPERYIAQLRLGQAIELGVAAIPGKKFNGELYFISPQVDVTSRTILVKAKIPNPDAQLKPGMLASLDLTLQRRENSVVIPETAVVRMMDNDRGMIFIVDSNGVAQLKPVKFGVRMPRQVEILEGLQGGEKVIVEGAQKIGPGTKVKFAPPESASPYLLATNSPTVKM